MAFFFGNALAPIVGSHMENHFAEIRPQSRGWRRQGSRLEAHAFRRSFAGDVHLYFAIAKFLQVINLPPNVLVVTQKMRKKNLYSAIHGGRQAIIRHHSPDFRVLTWVSTTGVRESRISTHMRLSSAPSLHPNMCYDNTATNVTVMHELTSCLCGKQLPAHFFAPAVAVKPKPLGLWKQLEMQ